MRWTIAQVAGVLVARAGAGLDPVARLAGVSIDSRTIRGGELFVAIHGPSHDGHDHVAGAFERGALAAVVAAAKWASSGRDSHECIVVDDTFVALKQFARAIRETWAENRGRYRLGGKNHDQEIPAALRRAVPRSQVGGNFNNGMGCR
jgi:UDP-N-acetylmuramoyl-tripeptide--D-alanyl-D-alanine ligase